MKQSLMNFHELVMNRIKTYQVHNNSLKFMKPSHELSWTSYELNWYYLVHKNAWLFMNLSIWTLWTKSWTTLVHQVFINIHDLMFMNVHEHSSTFITWWTSSRRGGGHWVWKRAYKNEMNWMVHIIMSWPSLTYIIYRLNLARRTS